MIDEKDRLLLSHLQKGLLLVRQPFSALGARIGSDVADVLLRVEKLKKEGFLSGIKAFWDHSRLGYQGAWAAMRFEKGALDPKARIVGSHPGVVYSAERDHDLNFWFFITLPAGHDMGAHIRILEKQAAPLATVFLPLRRVLKGVNFLRAIDEKTYEASAELSLNPAGTGSLQETQRQAPLRAGGLSLDEIRAIRAMQEDLPLTDEPYRRIAEELEMPAEDFLDLLKGLSQKGFLKSTGAYLAAGKTGPRPKTLVIWQIPGEKLGAAAEAFAGFPEIVYADLRSAYPEFPYSVHTLLGTDSAAELESLVRRIEDGIGKWPNRTVRTVREIKKAPMKYFPRELDPWWVKCRPLADEALQNST